MMDYLLNLTLDDWRNISIVAQGVLMIGLVATGIYQLLAIRAHAKRNATLEMCTRFSTDSVLCNSHRELHEARINNDLQKNPLKYRHAILPILNFLDMVAIGVERGIYDEDLAREYLKWVIVQNVKWYLTGNFPQKANIPVSGFSNLITLNNKWGDPTAELPEIEKNSLFNVMPKNS